jgi:nitroreductase
MNTTLALLVSRRSVPPHLLSGPGPDPEQLDQILTIASRVPDHGKLAPWRFLVIAGDSRLKVGEMIAAAYQADEPGAAPDRVAVERQRLARAPLVIGVVSSARPHVKIPEWEQVLSAGAVCMNLIVAANAIGYGTAWLSEWFSTDRRILDALGLAPTETMAGFIHIGGAAEPQPDRPRPALADIVTWI